MIVKELECKINTLLLIIRQIFEHVCINLPISIDVFNVYIIKLQLNINKLNIKQVKSNVFNKNDKGVLNYSSLIRFIKNHHLKKATRKAN